MKATYRVIAKSRESGFESVCYSGDSALLATDTYEDLIKRKAFVADFKIRMERLDPVIVMEND